MVEIPVPRSVLFPRVALFVACLAVFAVLVGSVGSAVKPAAAQEVPMPPIRETPPASDEVSVADYGLVNGIDTSRWQHAAAAPIDWSAVKASGMSFAIVKATEGSTVTDPWFERDYAQAGAAGLYRAAYAFARPTLPVSAAAADATRFVSIAGRFAGDHDLPPVLDVEATGGLNASDLSDWVATWVSTVQQLTGRDPMIYTGYYFWVDNVANTTRFSNLPLWYARYNTATQPGPLFGGWAGWTIWQWSSTGRVAGIAGDVDIDKFAGSASDLAALARSRSNVKPVAPTTPSVVSDVDGRLEVASTDLRGAVSLSWQVKPNGTWYTGFSMGIQSTSSPTLARNDDGRLELFVTSMSGELMHRWQLSPGGSWSGWASMGAWTTGTPAVSASADGRLEVFVEGRAHDLIHAWQVRDLGWSSWVQSGAAATDSPVLAASADGRLEVFTRGGDGTLLHAWQLVRSGAWSSFISTGTKVTAMPTLARNRDGRLDMFARDGNGGIVRSWQMIPNGPWSGWTWTGLWSPAGASVAVNADGRLEVFVVDAANRVTHSWQTGSSGVWSGFAPLLLTSVPAPVVGRNAKGTLVVFASDASGTIRRQTQVPNVGWSNAASLNVGAG